MVFSINRDINTFQGRYEKNSNSYDKVHKRCKIQNLVELPPEVFVKISVNLEVI